MLSKTSLELGIDRAKTKPKKDNQFARTSLKNKSKQLVCNQPRSRTQENYHSSINLIYIHTDFLKPLLNCTNQNLHKNKKQRNYSFSPRTLLTFVSFFLYRNKPRVMDFKALFFSCSLFCTIECPQVSFLKSALYITIKTSN